MEPKQSYRRKRKPGYLESSRMAHEKHITVKQENLYKPLLITFMIFIAVMVILFPTSIFDTNFPTEMAFIRKLVYWMSLSATATLFVLPVSVFDIQLLGIFSDSAAFSDWYVVFVIMFAVFSDTLFALIGYRFTKTLSKLFLRKNKRADINKSNDKLQKYGNIGMFFFASTPLPFTLAIYTAGAIRLNRRGFLIAVALGRLVKYSAFALFLRLFGINLVELGQSLLHSIFG